MHNVGFVSTRISGTDGVSLETKKWARVLERTGCSCFFMAGELDTPQDRSMLVPEAHFSHPDIHDMAAQSFARERRTRTLTHQMQEMKTRLKESIYEFLDRFDIRLLVPENVLSIPLNVPFGMALTEVISETGIPTLAHHHDFYWERQRFLSNCIWDYLNMAFPPHLRSMRHVVLNSSQAHQLGLRRGIAPTQIPNVMEFESPPGEMDDYAADVRETLGVAEDELFILQPTRIVQRKGIEHAVELVSRLGRKAKLVVSHSTVDEGTDYARRVERYSELLGVETVFADRFVSHTRRMKDGQKIYELGDLYRHADLITYPSTFEGFGNAFLESVYYRCPIVVNAYSVYHTDIRPKGFRVVELNGYVTDDAVNAVLSFLDDERLRRDAADHNYALAQRYYSFTVLRRKLTGLVCDCLGIADDSAFANGVEHE